MRHFIFISVVALTMALSLSWAEEDHEHDHEHGPDESAAAEVPANVGSDKGITEFHAEQGFKLSAEAMRNFEVKSLRLTTKGPWQIPLSSVMTSGEEINLYRWREGYFKRIDFEVLTTNNANKSQHVKSKDLREGDEVVISGVGFLRVAEISLSGGLDHGHSH